MPLTTILFNSLWQRGCSYQNVKRQCSVPVLKLRSVMDPISDTKKMIPSRTYAGRELLSMLEGMVELNKFLVDDQVIKKNNLKGITEMILNLNYSLIM